MLTECLFPAAIAVVVGVALLPAPVAIAVRRARRRGVAVDRGALVLWATALVYGVALPAYVLLPLPEPGFCLDAAAPVQVIPLRLVGDAIREQRGTGIGAVLANPAVQGAVLNVALFVPLGVLLRLLAGYSVRTVVLAGAAVSLLVELTQLTGLWGVYACSYRIFDVDDLLTNTTGVLLGARFAPLALRLLTISTTTAAPTGTGGRSPARAMIGVGTTS